jgi:hypothetical protein
MPQIETANVHVILSALDRQIGVHGGEMIGLVVCGGTALAALGLVTRTTKDVDVLCAAIETEDLITLHELKSFPPWLMDAASKVGRDFHLPSGWLNLGPASQVSTGLPEGFERRLTKKIYGEYLSVYFISRLDQIHFKLYAAVDRNDYHVQDLAMLSPTPDEMLAAARWTLTQDVSEVFAALLRDFLRRNGHGTVAERI